MPISRGEFGFSFFIASLFVRIFAENVWISLSLSLSSNCIVRYTQKMHKRSHSFVSIIIYEEKIWSSGRCDILNIEWELQKCEKYFTYSRTLFTGTEYRKYRMSWCTMGKIWLEMSDFLDFVLIYWHVLLAKSALNTYWIWRRIKNTVPKIRTRANGMAWSFNWWNT